MGQRVRLRRTSAHRNSGDELAELELVKNGRLAGRIEAEEEDARLAREELIVEARHDQAHGERRSWTERNAR